MLRTRLGGLAEPGGHHRLDLVAGAGRGGRDRPRSSWLTARLLRAGGSHVAVRINPGGAPGAPAASLPPPPSTETFTSAAIFQGPGASEGIRLPSGTVSGPARRAASGSGSRQGKW